MHGVNLFQDETGPYEEFWCRQSKCPIVTTNTSTGYFTIWVCHNGIIDAKKSHKHSKRL